jgi:hypothetical protein
MNLIVEAWHLVLSTSILYKFVNIALSLVMRSGQYFIKVVIIVEEFWVCLLDKAKEVLSVSLTSV